MTQFSALATPTATRAVLERFGLAPKKAFGQNFLVNDSVIGRILDLSEVSEADTVLEVGPGIGTLTHALLQHAGFVISVERDASLLDVLEYTLAELRHRFLLIRKDALDLQRADLKGHIPDKLVANLPYGVAATLVLEHLARFSSLTSVTVMVQREVACRMAAQPGRKDYGAYTVKLALRAVPVGMFSVSRNDFLPPPHVDSTVIRLDRRDDLPSWADEAVVQAACLMADAAFASRRKTIVNSCKAYFASRGASGAQVVKVLPQILEAADVSPRLRGEMLSPSTYLLLGRFLAENAAGGGFSEQPFLSLSTPSSKPICHPATRISNPRPYPCSTIRLRDGFAFQLLGNGGVFRAVQRGCSGHGDTASAASGCSF